MLHPSCRFNRRGTITPALVMVLVVLFAAAAVAIDYSFLSESKQEMQNGSDAAADAAVAIFVDDSTLLNSPAAAINLIAQARTAAIQYAQMNRVAGQPLALDPNLLNFSDGDITFGNIAPGTKVFVEAQNLNDPANTFLPTINAVQIIARRTKSNGHPIGTLAARAFGLATVDMRTRSIAMLDHDVAGFRPNTSSPLPLAPIAILSDPTAANTQSWEYNVVQGNGPVTGSGLHAIVVQFAAGGGGNPNGVALSIGTPGDGTSVSNQLTGGITPAQLQSFGAPFVLDATNQLGVSGPAAPLGPTDYAALASALSALQAGATQRIFPLYSAYSSGPNQATLSGFVAARVLNVVPMNGAQPLTFMLQPTVIATSSAVPGASRPGVGGPVTTPNVVKIRLVQ
jgi:Flp pilus assembly protein TadG